MWPFNRRAAPDAPRAPSAGIFTTDVSLAPRSREDWTSAIFQRTNTDFKPVATPGAAMDSNVNIPTLKGGFALNSPYTVPDALISWYASQSFIGYQMCAILAQQWMVDKACTMPAKDAIRNGYEITVNDGVEVAPEILDFMRKRDRKYGLVKNCVELVRMCRVFGIRIAIFKIDGVDYEAPFNLDGVTPGSYRGISQVDPYWITPELDETAATDPAGIHFYEPTYWRVNGRRYHRSHLIVIRTCELPDVLKPTYFYGGIPLTQRIYERVYAAERTANEAPMLAMSKRTTIMNVDLSQAAGNQASFEDRLREWAAYRDNYGIKVAGLEETISQLDTSLTDMDALIMTQYQLVASIAEVPATKLLGVQPKGFNSTGEYEEASYHEMLESVQEHDLAPLINRHHELVIRSDVRAKFPDAPKFTTEVAFNPLDSATAEELAERNFKNAQSDLALAQTGAIDGTDIRRRLIADPDSGYTGMSDEPIEPLDDA
jgi:hypothetical protein